MLHIPGEGSLLGALNFEFYLSLYLPAERVLTLALIQDINVQTDRYIRLQLLLTSGFENAEREQRQILDMCKARDPDIVKLMEDHIIRAGRDLVAALIDRRTSGIAAE